MAWQLIYTSAPRLLEAGRSGFGTVARHRQISPLLVSAIERASQFARLQGLDAGRTIYCHRIIAVAGGRFHVLSCIRDAGADYTGRTNHIAHHVIAEQREVAALGTSGPSPADVLLAIPWRAAWDEAPRFLEADDEISLANFTAQTGTQWTQVTGDQRNAWLLAAGEASRGAYLLHAPGTDLRALFAESLRLAPDRLWQIPFTTALQPSDEPSDFRWIGVEADSTLRAQAESSARPVLDLTRPGTLPAPDVPANAATIGIPRPSALGTTAAPSAPQPRKAVAANGQPLRKQIPSSTARRPRNRKWLYAGVAALLAFAASFSAIQSRIAESRSTRSRQQALRQKVADWHVFSPQTADHFLNLKPEKLSPADQVLDEVGKAMGALKAVAFDKMRDCKSGGELKQMGDALSIEVPAEMQSFADRVRQLASLNLEISKAAAMSSPERAAYDALQRQRDAIKSFAKESQATNAFSPAVDDLRKNRERAEAAAVLRLMHPRDSQNQNLPPVEVTIVQEQLSRGKPADAAAAKSFTEAERLMKAWESVQATPTDRVADSLAAALRDSRNEWPEWLVKQAEAALAKSRGESAPAPSPSAAAKNFPAVPLYIFNGLGAMKDARFQELEKGFTFQLRAPFGANPTPLIDPIKQGKLHRNISEPALFAVDESDKSIAPQAAAEKLSVPFALLAKDAGGKDAMQFWIVKDSDKPLLLKKSAGLTRSGNLLVIDAAQLALPGAPKSGMTLLLPQDAAIGGRKIEPLQVKDWAVDLAPLCEQIMRAKKETERLLKSPDSAAAPLDEAATAARLKELKQTVIDAVVREINDSAADKTRLLKNENNESKREKLSKPIEAERTQRIEQARKDFGDEAAPLFKQVGGCVQALCREAIFQGHDDLFRAGGELSFLDPGADAKALAKAFGAVRQQTHAAIGNIVGSVEIARYTRSLRAIESMATLLSPETPELKKTRANSAAQLAAKQEELRRIAAHPLLSDRVPPGLYLLSVFADGVEIPLLEIEIAR